MTLQVEGADGGVELDRAVLGQAQADRVARDVG